MPDSNGIISKETVYKSELPREIIKVIRPLIDELETLDESLDFEEFIEAMDILMKSISPAERSILLQTSKARAKPEVYDFKPKINEKKGFSVSPTRVRSRAED